MKIEISEMYADQKMPANLYPVFVLQPENEAERFQIESISHELKEKGLVNYHEASKPYRSTQITLPLIQK